MIYSGHLTLAECRKPLTCHRCAGDIAIGGLVVRLIFKTGGGKHYAFPLHWMCLGFLVAEKWARHVENPGKPKKERSRKQTARTADPERKKLVNRCNYLQRCFLAEEDDEKARVLLQELFAQERAILTHDAQIWGNDTPKYTHDGVRRSVANQIKFSEKIARLESQPLAEEVVTPETPVWDGRHYPTCEREAQRNEVCDGTIHSDPPYACSCPCHEK